MLAKWVDSGEYNKNKVYHGGRAMQREFAPSYELPTGKNGAMFRTQFRIAMLAKWGESGEYNKNKVYREGRAMQREFAPSYELPTGKDGAMFRTQFRIAMLAKWVDSGEYNKNKVYPVVDLVFMAPATGIEPITNP